MGLLSLSLPEIGEPSPTADQKVRDGFVAIQTGMNGNLDDANIAANAGIQQRKIANGPTGMAIGSFSAYRAAAVSLGVASPAFALFDTEEFDVSGWHDTATGRYTPQVPGYYRLSWMLTPNTAVSVWWRSILYKNGSAFKIGNAVIGSATAQTSGGTAVVQANGTTDFFQVAASWDNGGAAVSLGASLVNVWFQGELVGRA
jgi:hypothetical protein